MLKLCAHHNVKAAFKGLRVCAAVVVNGTVEHKRELLKLDALDALAHFLEAAARKHDSALVRTARFPGLSRVLKLRLKGSLRKDEVTVLQDTVSCVVLNHYIVPWVLSCLIAERTGESHS